MKQMQTMAGHAAIILAAMFLLFLVLDTYNPMMNFVDNAISRPLLGIMCCLTVLVSCLLIRDRRRDMRLYENETHELEERI